MYGNIQPEELELSKLQDKISKNLLRQTATISILCRVEAYDFEKGIVVAKHVLSRYGKMDNADVFYIAKIPNNTFLNYPIKKGAIGLLLPLDFNYMSAILNPDLPPSVSETNQPDSFIFVPLIEKTYNMVETTDKDVDINNVDDSAEGGIVLRAKNYIHSTADDIKVIARKTAIVDFSAGTCTIITKENSTYDLDKVFTDLQEQSTTLKSNDDALQKYSDDLTQAVAKTLASLVGQASFTSPFVPPSPPQLKTPPDFVGG